MDPIFLVVKSDFFCHPEQAEQRAEAGTCPFNARRSEGSKEVKGFFGFHPQNDGGKKAPYFTPHPNPLP